MNWTWFGTFKIERKPLRGEENHHLLPWHAHLTSKPTSHYLQPPQVPPTEEDPNEMDVEPKSPVEKMIIVANNFDGPITTMLAKNALPPITQSQQQPTLVNNLQPPQQPSTSSLNHPSVSNVIGSSVSSSISFSTTTTNTGNNLIVNALQSPLANTIPVNSLNNSNPISSISASPHHHQNSLISQSLAQGPIIPPSSIANSAINSNLLGNSASINNVPTPVHSTSVLSATLQQPTLHSQLQQRPPATASNTSGATIHHLNPNGPGMASLAKIPRMSATSANPSLNQMLGMPPKQSINNPSLDFNSSVSNHMNNQPMMSSMNNSMNNHPHQIIQNNPMMHNQLPSNLMHQTPMQSMQANNNLLSNSLSQQPQLNQTQPQTIETSIVPPPNAKQPKKPKQPRKQRKNAKNQQANNSANNQQPPPIQNAPPNVSNIDNGQPGAPSQMNQIPPQRTMEYNNYNYNPNNVVTPQPQQTLQQNPQWYQPPQPVPSIQQINQQPPPPQVMNTSMNTSMNNTPMNTSMNNNIMQTQVMNQTPQAGMSQPPQMVNMGAMNRQGMMANQMMNQPQARQNIPNAQLQNQMVNQQQQLSNQPPPSNQMIGSQGGIQPQGRMMQNTKAALDQMLIKSNRHPQQQPNNAPPMNASINNSQGMQQSNQQFIYQQQQQQQRGPMPQMNQSQQMNNFAPNNLAAQQMDNTNQQQFIQQPMQQQYIAQQR